MIKKILSFIMAILITFTMMTNSFKANAVAVPVSLLAYLIQACADILVGSGTVTQSQFNKMSTSDVFDMTKQVAPSVSLPLPDLPYYLMKFISQHPEATLPYSIWDILRDAGFSDFIFDNADNLDKVCPELQGFGASAVVKIYTPSGSIDNIAVYFGSYGIIKKGVFSQIYGDKIIRQYTDVYHDSPMKEYEYSGAVTVGGAFGLDNAEVKYVGDWRYPDGTPATDMLSFTEEIPAPIGTVDVDGKTYDVNGDGTVNIDDNSYTINDDGSITIDGKTYYPDYDFSNYDQNTLIQLLLSILNNIDVKDDSTTDTDIEDSDVDVSGDIANSELSSLTMPKTIATVFPFCIPWDFYHGIKLLSEKPVAPRFEVPFELPAYKSFPGFKKMIVIDFSEYSTAFAVVRWTMFTIFMFGLCFITFKIVKGA